MVHERPQPQGAQITLTHLHIQGSLRIAASSIDSWPQKRLVFFLTIMKIRVYRRTILPRRTANDVGVDAGIVETAT
jgi:hypothetical protein